MNQFDTNFLDFVKQHGNGNDISVPAIVNDNICEGCGLTIRCDGNYDFICESCGRKNDIKVENDEYIKSGINKRCLSKSSGGAFCSPQNYSYTQLQSILQMLKKCHQKNPDIYIPLNVLSEVARKYNFIQNRAGKDFVKRGNVKNSIIASLIMKISSAYGFERKKKTIAKFVGLNTNGFSTGEDLLIEISLKYDIKICEEVPLNERVFNCADDYVRNLGIDKKYAKIASDIVIHSEQKSIGMRNQLTSKVAGTIYGIIKTEGIQITCKQIEKACGNCKKNTFNKFWKNVQLCKEEFSPFLSQLNNSDAK